MSDLSRLLGDVYGSGPATEDQNEDGAPTVPLAPDATDSTDVGDGTPAMAAAPPARLELSEEPALDWADETTLDQAFASWVPGPAADAPAAERRLMGDEDLDLDPDPSPDPDATVAVEAPLPPSAEWLFEDGPPPPEVGAPTPGAPAEVRAWTRSDDDILPAGSRRRRRR